MWFSGHTVRRLLVQVNLAGEVRLVMIGSSPDTSGHWLDVGPGDTIDVTDRRRHGGEPFRRDRSDSPAATGGPWSTAPMTEWNHQFRSVPVAPNVALSGAEHAARIGVSIEPRPGARTRRSASPALTNRQPRLPFADCQAGQPSPDCARPDTRVTTSRT